MMKLFAGLGCFAQLCLLVLVTWLNILAIGYVLLVLAGTDAQLQWQNAALFIKIAIAFILSGLPIPAAALAFLLSLFISQPLF